MKQIFIIATFSFCIIFLTAQNPSWKWAYGSVTTNADNTRMQATCFDKSGDVVFAGKDEGINNVRIHGVPVSPYNGGLLLGKCDTAGNVLWLRGHGGGGPQYVYRIETDSSDNIYVMGHYFGLLSFPGFTSGSFGAPEDMYVAKFDSNGNFLWARTGTNTSYSDYPRDMSVDEAGNSYIVGEFSTTINFVDTIFSAQNLYDGYIISFDPAGNFRWAQQLKGVAGEEFKAVEVEPGGTVAAIGHAFNLNCSVGGVNMPSGIHLVRFNSQTGAVMYHKKLSSTDCNVSELERLGDGKLLMAGEFADSLHFGTTINMNGPGAANIYLAQFDSLGNEIWARGTTSSASGECYLLGCDVDASGNAYVTGQIWFDQTFGSSVYTTAGNTGGIVASWDKNGNLKWSRQPSEPIAGEIRDLVADDLGRLYLPGTFFTSIDFDTSLSLTNSTAIYSCYIARLDVPAISFTLLNSTLCNGSTFTLPIITAVTFNAGNIFTAEISDAGGSFISPTSIGQVTATGNTNMTCTIPGLLPSGSGYRIRVTASNSPFISEDNGSNITIAANQLAMASIVQTGFCQGQSFSMPFTVVCPLTSGNIFRAQLSDASGSFAFPVIIGSLTSTNSGTINATIPLLQTPGAGYRIRVISTNTAFTSTDNGADLSVFVLPASPLITAFGDSLVSSAATSYQWKFNGSIIGGAIQQSHIAAQTGNYTVTVTDLNGCSNTSSQVFVSVVGRNHSIISQGKVSIFPNPADENVILQVSGLDGSMKIELINVSGIIVKSWDKEIPKNTTNLELNISELPSGYYFMRLNCNGQIFAMGLAVK